MALIFSARFERRQLTRREWGVGILMTAAAAILPLVFYFGGEHVHAMRDPEMFRLHEFIDEFRSYFLAAPFATFFGNFLLLPLCLPVAVGLVIFGRLNAVERWTLWIGSFASLGMLALMFFEGRWAGYFAQCSVVVMALSLAAGFRVIEASARNATLAAALAILGGCAAFLFAQQDRKLTQLLAGDALDMQMAQKVLVKRFAVQMAHAVGNRDVRLLPEPSLAPALYYFGHLPSVATLYWENRDGLHAAADFFDATNDDAARRIATARGLSYVLIPDSGSVPAVYHEIRTGEPPPPGYLNLAGRLMKGSGIPAWMSRESGMANLGNCVFGNLRLSYPVSVWKIAPEKQPRNP
jgi:hypothetical protein